MDRLGRLVRKARERKGVTLSQGARRCRLTAGYLSAMEVSSTVWVSDRVAKSLAKAYGIPRARLTAAVNTRRRNCHKARAS